MSFRSSATNEAFLKKEVLTLKFFDAANACRTSGKMEEKRLLLLRTHSNREQDRNVNCRNPVQVAGRLDFLCAMKSMSFVMKLTKTVPSKLRLRFEGFRLGGLRLHRRDNQLGVFVSALQLCVFRGAGRRYA